jgi:hypothetical protein
MKNLTFHGMWKTSLLFLSPCRRETLNFPPSRFGKGARGLGQSLAFPHDLNCQMKNGFTCITSTEITPTGRKIIKGAIHESCHEGDEGESLNKSKSLLCLFPMPHSPLPIPHFQLVTKITFHHRS